MLPLTLTKQLSTTLTNFDQQREAAGKITEELKRVDARQRQLELQTEELERILEGHAPITREDLSKSNTASLVYGAIMGFLLNLMATYVYNRFIRKKAIVG